MVLDFMVFYSHIHKVIIITLNLTKQRFCQ
jgi:hypothetical protein